MNNSTKLTVLYLSVWCVQLFGADANVIIRPSEVKWTISPYLIGMHGVYVVADDNLYDDDVIANWAREANIGTFRFPGGSIVKYWDWETPSGDRTVDPWAPDYDGSVTDENGWMSLDEYLHFADVSGIMPLIGVNYRSGYVYDRVEDSIERAARMVQYVKDYGYEGVYYFIGNEDRAQVGGLEKSAELFARHSLAMKAVDPLIKVIYNNNGESAEQLKRFMAIAGDAADGVDFHGKWPRGGAESTKWPNVVGTYELWKSETPLQHHKFEMYNWRDRIAILREAAAEAGYPDLMMMNLEYGCGKKTSGFNKFTVSMMLLDFLQEQFIAGYDMTALWDNSSGNCGNDGRLIGEDRRLNPFHYGWEFLGRAQGKLMLVSESDHTHVYGFAAKANDEYQLYLINKTEQPQTLSVSFEGAVGKPASEWNVQAKTLVDGDAHWGQVKQLFVRYNASNAVFEATLPAISYTQLLFQGTGESVSIEENRSHRGRQIRRAHVNGRGIVAGPVLAWGDKGHNANNWRDFPSQEARRRYARYVVARYGYFLRDSDEDGLTDKSNSLDADSIRHATWDIVMAGNTASRAKAAADRFCCRRRRRTECLAILRASTSPTCAVATMR